MSNKDFLNNLALEVNSLLTDYITIHDRRLKEGGTFWSLFRKVRFKSIYITTSILQKRFMDKACEFELITQRELQTFNADERKFFRCLWDYFLALYWAVQKLNALAEAQYGRSQNTKDLSWKENQRLEKEHKEAVKRYLTLGRTLQEAYSNFFQMSDNKVLILRETIDKKNFPILYKWAQEHPDTLEAQVKSIAKAWHEGNIMSALQALESDMEHG